MLQFFQSNDMSALTNAFCERSRLVETDPFIPSTVIVQSFGTGQWLKLQLAEKQGICANLDCVLPAHFIWELYRKLLNQPEHSPLDKDLLSWRLMSLIPEEKSAEFDPVRRYLQAPGDPDLRTYQLANKIAGLFDQYLVYRPEWILAWQKRKDPIKNNPHPWQPLLWRSLMDSNPELAAQHRAGLHERAIEEIDNLADLSLLPPRVSVFGLSSLPLTQLETLRALSAHIDVDVFFLNPCRYYWGDIVSEKGQAKRSVRQLIKKAGALIDEDYLEAGNPLLASMGKQGREFLELILDSNDINPLDFFAEKPALSALGFLQKDIFNLEFAGEFGRNETPKKIKLDDSDRSIQIHNCHSKLREIEILYDQILSILSLNPETRPGDIIVMTPNVADYAPFIHSVFKDHIHYGIADRSLVEQSALIGSFSKLLELPQLRLTSIEVMDFLEVPAIARKFNLDEDELSTISYWINEAGIRWEVDGSSKSERWQVPDNGQNTWRFGLDRLLLGIAMDSRNGLFNANLPFDVDISDAELLGTLCRIVELLDRYRLRLDKSQTAPEWQTTINSLLNDFFTPIDAETLDISMIQTLMQKLVDDNETADYQGEISGRLMLYWVSQQFADTSSSAGFISGGITFATLVPMRSIPFKVVCLLGMNDREYPRDNRSLSFDLMTTTKSRKGDRSRRADDRYLFLEAMLSASEILYISYEGRSLKDNQLRPPSVVVSELLDYVSQVFETVEVIEHPLQPFSRRYFTGTALTSFQDHWYRALLEPSHNDAFVDVKLPAIEENNLESIQQLASFFQHSAKYFLQQRLGVYFGSDETMLQDTESFSLDNLQRYQLADSALNALIRGQDINGWQDEMRASGFVMQGPIGESYMDSELQHALIVYSELKNYLDEATDTYQGTITVSGDKLQGHLGHRAGDFILNFRSGTLRQRHMIENWINHLFASAAGLNVTSISVSRGKNKAEVNRFKAIPRGQAVKHLEKMVSLYYTGLNSPLFLPPETTFGFAKSMAATEDVELAKEAALNIYNGGDFSESSDLYWTRMFDVTTMMDDNFAEQAGLIYGPLFISWQEMSS